VTYDPWRCMGCRYCMIACPFQIPAYEYNNALSPKVQKCSFCFQKISKQGGVPACVEICPPQSLTFGKRKDLLVLAKQKIEASKDFYLPYIYGEHEVGGTSWIYIANKPFSELGFPTLPSTPPKELPEKIQHGVFKNFIPQIGLISVLGLVSHLSSGKDDAQAPNTQSGPTTPLQPHEEPPAAPIPNSFFTPGVFVLMLISLIGFGFGVYRLIFGIGAVANLNDQYPWGIWIGIDVATGVALAAGGFTTSALAHIFHRSEYETVVRPALLTALLGYTFVCLGLSVDLGRYYNIWHPLVPSMWSGNSVLFEVGICVSFYLTVLYIEFLPIVVERFRGKVNLPGNHAKLNSFIESMLDFAEQTLRKVITMFILAGVVLSCLHQSSLGALMLIAPTKIHPLWFTPILPLLFLLSAICVGFPMVIFESMIAGRSFGRKPEMSVLTPLSKYIPVFLAIYLFFKIGDLFIRGVGSHLIDGSFQSTMFIAEITIGVVLPLFLLIFEKVRKSPALLFTAASLVIFGVAFNRVNVFLTAYTPVYKVAPYFPSLGEIAITVGLFSGLMLVYRALVTIFPVLPAEEIHFERGKTLCSAK